MSQQDSFNADHYTNDPRQNPDNWDGDSDDGGDDSGTTWDDVDVIGGGRVDDDEPAAQTPDYDRDVSERVKESLPDWMIQQGYGEEVLSGSTAGSSSGDSENNTNNMNDPRQNPDNWDGDSNDGGDDSGTTWDDTDVTGGGRVDDDAGGGLVGDTTDGSEYTLDNDPRQNPDNWQSDSGDASDVTGGGRVDPEDDDWAQEQRAAYEERMAALMADLPVPDQLGGSEGGGGLSPALGGVALLALAGGGALYLRGES